MSYSKPRAGQPLGSGPARSAAFYSDAIDVINAFKRGQTPPGQRSVGGQQTDIVQIKNLTGDDRERGEVVQLGNYLLDDFDPAAPWFEGNTVAAPLMKRFAILIDATKEDEIGSAQVSGRCSAMVNVIHASHRYALPKVGSTKLDSSICGPLELLSPPDGTGDQELWVKFCAPPVVLVKTTGAFTANTPAATYEVYGGTLGSETSIAQTVPNAVSRSAIASGKWGHVTLRDNGLGIEPEEC